MWHLAIIVWFCGNGRSSSPLYFTNTFQLTIDHRSETKVLIKIIQLFEKGIGKCLAPELTIAYFIL